MENLKQFYKDIYPYLADVLPEFEFRFKNNKATATNTARPEHFFGNTDHVSTSTTTGRTSVFKDKPHLLADVTKQFTDAKGKNKTETISIVNYLIDSKQVADFREAILLMCERSGVPSPLKPLTPEQKEQKERFKIRQTLADWFNSMLMDEKPFIDYLRSRGIDHPTANALKFGVAPEYNKIESYLKEQGFTHKVIEQINPEFRSNGIGSTHRLAIPIKDHKGRVTGFKFRRITSGADKYTATAKKMDKHLRALHWAEPLKTEAPIYLMEGEIDASLTAVRVAEHEPNKYNFVALEGAGKGIDTNTLKLFKKASNEIYLCLDADRAGKQHTAEKIKVLYEQGFDVYTIEMPNGLDPADFWADHVFMDFEELPKLYGWKFALDELIDRTPEQPNDKQQNDFLKDVIDLCVSFPKQQEKRFLIELKEYTNIEFSELAIKELANKQRQKAEEEANQQAIKAAFEDAAKYMSESKINKAYDVIQKARKPKAALKELLNSSSDIVSHEISQAVEGLNIHLGEQIDEFIKLPVGAPTLICGLPSHGKTTLMLNVLVRQLLEGHEVVFFTYEEPRSKLVVKIINCLRSIWAGGQVPQAQEGAPFIQRAIKNNTYQNNSFLNYCIERVYKWLDTESLIIVDKTLSDDDLTDTIRLIENPEAIVYIDYIQKIPSKAEARIATVSNKLQALCKDLNMCFVIGAQFNREASNNSKPEINNLKGASELEQDAALVLRIYRPNEEEEGREVTALKNRGGTIGYNHNFYFDGLGTYLKPEANPKAYTCPIDVNKDFNEILETNTPF